ncbi:hypothetical protein BJ138DRAFT_1102991 [Hygrophoropsis aurantiaca]|uniref:Uncharacterized protein n=1 Tax=Hygrophoropsis aurantiaca TaxID=72124 RepID=A0ACB8A771_9AGAM|nr:hypothetical protein BJ138DRAFT_1102991 [Hygrophoropsis aurantiaca]
MAHSSTQSNASATMLLQRLSEQYPAWMEKKINDLRMLPDDDSATRFPLVDGITGRVMRCPQSALFLLEFFRPDGSYVKDAPQIELYDVTGGGPAPIFITPDRGGFGSTMHFYYVCPLREYGVRYNGVLKKTISFPHVVVVS